MSIRTASITCTLLVALAACATSGRGTPASPGEAAAASAPSIAALFPESFAGFSQRGRLQFDNPALGVGVSYVSPRGLGVEAYLYPVPPSGRDTSAAGRRNAARDEAHKAAGDLQILADQGLYRDIRLGSPEELTAGGPPGHSIPGTYLPGSLTVLNRSVLTDIYVFVLADQFLKVRSTYPAGDGGEAARAEIRAFALSLAVMLDPNAAPRPGDPRRLPVVLRGPGM